MFSDLILGRETGYRRRLGRKILSLIFSSNSETSNVEESVSEQKHSEQPHSVSFEEDPEPPRDVTPPYGYEVALHLDALPQGTLKEVIAAGQKIVLARIGDAVYAFDNQSPYVQGPLSEGIIESGTVCCPYQSWKFNLEDGQSLLKPEESIQMFPVHIEGKAICVEI